MLVSSVERRCVVTAAIHAAHTFYNATTMMKVKAIDRFGAPAVRKVKSKMLCQTTDPEEKRTIIGDTFMNVRTESSLFFFILPLTAVKKMCNTPGF